MSVHEKLKTHIVQRTVYLNVMYSLMILLSALVVGVLVAPEDVDGEHFPRYQVCKLGDNSTTFEESDDGVCRKFVDATYNVDADPSFVPLTTDKELATAQQTTYEIAAATVAINAVLFTHSILQHVVDHENHPWREMMVKIHQSAGFVISLVNLGLFAGLLGWLYSVTGVDNEDNFKYNVYFKDVNIVYVAITGLVGSMVDLAFQLYLLLPHCIASLKDRNAECWL